MQTEDFLVIYEWLIIRFISFWDWNICLLQMTYNICRPSKLVSFFTCNYFLLGGLPYIQSPNDVTQNITCILYSKILLKHNLQPFWGVCATWKLLAIMMELLVTWHQQHQMFLTRLLCRNKSFTYIHSIFVPGIYIRMLTLQQLNINNVPICTML